MLVYKAAGVVACVAQEPKSWSMKDKDGKELQGTNHLAKLAVFGALGDVASITLKAKTAEELKAKMAKYTIGKPAEIPIVSITPVFRQGDRKPSGYEYIG